MEKERSKKKRNRDKRKEEEEEDLSKLIFKPSGPEGRFWGQFRQFNDEEIEMFLTKQEIEDQKKLEQEIRERKIKKGQVQAEKVGF